MLLLPCLLAISQIFLSLPLPALETAEELTTVLYRKMKAEQDTYRDWLLGLPPEEILDHAYEYSVFIMDGRWCTLALYGWRSFQSYL